MGNSLELNSPYFNTGDHVNVALKFRFTSFLETSLQVNIEFIKAKSYLVSILVFLNTIVQ